MSRLAKVITPTTLKWTLCRDMLAGTAWLALMTVEDGDGAILYEFVHYDAYSKRSIRIAAEQAYALTREYREAGYDVALPVDLQERMFLA